MKTVTKDNSAIFLICALLCAAASAAFCVGFAAPDIAQILAFSGRDHGIALVTDGGSLASGLVAASNLIVVDQQPDEAHRATAARLADKAGTLGRRLYVAIGSPTTCVLADGYADIVLNTTATDKTLTPECARELARVVAPYGGVLVVGNPGGQAVGLTKAALIAWVATLGEHAEIRTENGLWAVWKRPGLVGGDDWTQWYYDASANPVSKDTAFTYPYELAWTANPLITARTLTRVAAGGRLFTITRPHQRDGGMFQTHRFEGGNDLIARSLANGEILWRYPLGEDAYPDRSSLIATSEAVYVMRREKILVFDPQSGVERTAIAPVQAPGEVKSIWLHDSVLLALTGPTRDEPAWCSVAGTGYSGKKLTEALMGAKFGFGDTLVAYDVTTGKERWHWTEPLIDSRMIGIGPDGLVVAYAKGKEVIGLNIADGSVRWKQIDPVIIAAIETFGTIFGEHGDYFANTTGAPGVILTPDIVLIGHSQQMKRVVLSPKDGSLLWTQQLYDKDGVDHELVAFFTPALSFLRLSNMAAQFIDPKTGNVVPAPKQFGQASRGCGAVAATPRYLLSNGNGAFFDLEKNLPLITPPIKGECGRTSFTADGTLVAVGGACSGCPKIYGTVALRGFCRLDLRQPPPPAQRLATGVGTAGAAAATDVRDWPTQRHDARRSGGTPVSVSDKACIRWQWKPGTPYPAIGGNLLNVFPLDTEYRLVEPVCVGSLIVIAGGEGAVTGLDRLTGKERWRTQIGGCIQASPTIAGGLVFVGCTDGTLSALSATDGILVWRYRIAPYERRVMSYGHLQSQWPVTCSPLVADGVVYATAGQVASSGGYVVALDAATGHLDWEQSFVPWSKDEYPGRNDNRSDLRLRQMVPVSGLALDGDRLFVKMWGSVGPYGLALDRHTGAMAIPKQINSIFDLTTGWQRSVGTEISVLPDGLVLSGGYFQDRSQNCLGYGVGNGTQGAIADPLSNDGLRIGSMNTYIPCWNDKLLIAFGPLIQRVAPFGLRAFDLAAKEAEIVPQFQTWSQVKVITGKVTPLWGPISPDTGEDAPDHWQKTGNYALATVLAANTVLTTSLKLAPVPAMVPFPLADKPLTGESYKIAQITGGQVSAFAAKDGKIRWSVDLPAPPAASALALDRDGNAIIGLQDGSVVCVGAALVQNDLHAAEVDATGEWLVSTAMGDKRTMTITQKGAVLTGQVPDGQVLGEVKGNQVKIWLLNDPATMGTGTLKGDEIDGEYTCRIENRGGAWHATRRNSDVE